MLCNHHLRAFLQVAEAGSFAKAAEVLHVSSTALIKQINLFENELKLRLFKRSARGISLTSAGAFIYKEGLAYYQAGEEILKKAQSLEEQANIIKIGSSPLTSGAFVASLYQSVADLIPKVRIKLVPFVNEPSRAAQILYRLGEEIDIVVGVYDEHFLSAFDNEAQLLYNAPIALAFPHGHPLSQRKSLALHELSGQKVFMIRQGWMASFDTAREILSDPKLNLELESFEFFDVESFNRAENAGAGLVVIKNFLEAHPLFSYVPLNWNLTASFGIIHSKKPSPAVQEFLAALQTKFPETVR